MTTPPTRASPGLDRRTLTKDASHPGSPRESDLSTTDADDRAGVRSHKAQPHDYPLSPQRLKRRAHRLATIDAADKLTKPHRHSLATAKAYYRPAGAQNARLGSPHLQRRTPMPRVARQALTGAIVRRARPSDEPESPRRPRSGTPRQGLTGSETGCGAKARERSVPFLGDSRAPTGDPNPGVRCSGCGRAWIASSGTRPGKHNRSRPTGRSAITVRLRIAPFISVLRRSSNDPSTRLFGT